MAELWITCLFSTATLRSRMEDQECDALSSCFPEQARTTEGSEGASKDPENVSSAMQIQGVSTRFGLATATRCNRLRIVELEHRHFWKKVVRHRQEFGEPQ
jgi:hypothetical protein